MKSFVLWLAVSASMALSAAAAPRQLKLTEKNIDKVLKELTLEEKAQLMVGYTFGNCYWGIPTDPDPNAGDIVLGAAGNTAKIERFGIPHTVLSDGPAGINIEPYRANDDATYFCTAVPIGSAIAASWDKDMAFAMGEIIGQEGLDYGIDVVLGPGLNLMRNPLCGRNFEYYSEDPVLSGNIAAGYVNGVQSKGLGTSPKHFAANSQESNRTHNDDIISQRAFRELYLKGFEIMVKESKPWTIMSSYNLVNGVSTQENPELLEDILRDEWGFDGIVMTDWSRVKNTAAQVHAGNDLLEPGLGEQITAIIEGVNNGSISMADVDRNVKRILQYIVKTPAFKGHSPANKTDLTGHAAVVRQHAPGAMVLLKNESKTLPYSGGKNVALFGANSYRFYAGGSGSGDVNSLLKVDLDRGLVEAGFQLDTVISELYTKYRDFATAEAEAEMGRFSSNSYWPRPRVAEPTLGEYTYAHAADRNDVAIVTIARKSGEGCDRKFDDYSVYPDEIALLKGVYDAFNAKGKKVIVIINTGGSFDTEPLKQYSDAILLAWQPGVAAGNSVADVITGVSYPSGKLPMTWAKSINDVPSSANFPVDFDWRDDFTMTQEQIQATPNLGETLYKEGIDVGYRYFAGHDDLVSYPFGYGLSYTEFEYSQPEIVRKGDKYIATVTIKNVGEAPGREVVQLYVTAPAGKLDKPARELKAFAKTSELQPGESDTVTMTFTNYDLASFDEELSAFVTDGGDYVGHFAASSTDLRHSIPFGAKAATYKVYNVMKPTKEL